MCLLIRTGQQTKMGTLPGPVQVAPRCRHIQPQEGVEPDWRGSSVYRRPSKFSEVQVNDDFNPNLKTPL